LFLWAIEIYQDKFFSAYVGSAMRASGLKYFGLLQANLLK